ncbi:MAG: hypothetical protein BMS9Abin11_0838 [Gammaproteobacteria bacterium]|nr:MAG: hypothetical protein BMS9Abin11_0838 [Gammaproteobacteria bacterium]
MSKKNVRSAIATAIGATFLAAAATAPVANAAENPFSLTQIKGGYQVAGKKGEGNCGGKKSKKGESNCGGKKGKGMKGESHCGGKKDGESHCGGKKDKKSKKGEASCGEAKCGGSK